MKFLSIAVLLALPCMAETWNNVAIVDVNCSNKVKANPDAHTRDCAVKCEKSGYAIVTSNGTVLKLDENGNKEAVAALKATKSSDHLRATVTGEKDGDIIKVKSLKM
jgi:hypothetical protein